MRKLILLTLALLMVGQVFADSFRNKVVKHKGGTAFFAIYEGQCIKITALHVDERARRNILEKKEKKDMLFLKTKRKCSLRIDPYLSLEVGDEVVLIAYPKRKRSGKPHTRKTKIKKIVNGSPVAVYNKYKIKNYIVTEKAGKHGAGSSGGLACKIVQGVCVPFGVIIARKNGEQYISPFYSKLSEERIAQK